MPKLLFLTFYFPPCSAIASIRTGNLARQLSRAGWEVTVVTPNPVLWRERDGSDQLSPDSCPRLRMLYTGHRFTFLSSGLLNRQDSGQLSRLLGGLGRRVRRLLGIDEMIGWYSEAERACATVTPENVDVILVSGGPFGAFRVAERVSRRLHRPFVLDYRDLWTSNPYARIRNRSLTCRAERRLLELCDGVTVVSRSMASVLGKQYRIPEKISIVPNGYDPELMAHIQPACFNHFALVYAGRFYPPKSDVTPLLTLLRGMLHHGEMGTARLHYYGPQDSYVCDTARRFGLSGSVECHGNVARVTALEAIRGAGAAAVITSIQNRCDEADQGVITGKIFEVIGLRTPYLVIAPSGSDLEPLVASAGGGSIFQGSDVDGMLQYMLNLMEHRAPQWMNPERYSWPVIVQEADAKFHRLLRVRPKC